MIKSLGFSMFPPGDQLGLWYTSWTICLFSLSLSLFVSQFMSDNCLLEVNLLFPEHLLGPDLFSSPYPFFKYSSVFTKHDDLIHTQSLLYSKCSLHTGLLPEYKPICPTANWSASPGSPAFTVISGLPKSIVLLSSLMYFISCVLPIPWKVGWYNLRSTGLGVPSSYCVTWHISHYWVSIFLYKIRMIGWQYMYILGDSEIHMIKCMWDVSTKIQIVI